MPHEYIHVWDMFLILLTSLQIIRHASVEVSQASMCRTLCRHLDLVHDLQEVKVEIS